MSHAFSSLTLKSYNSGEQFWPVNECFGPSKNIMCVVAILKGRSGYQCTGTYLIDIMDEILCRDYEYVLKGYLSHFLTSPDLSSYISQRTFSDSSILLLGWTAPAGSVKIVECHLKVFETLLGRFIGTCYPH